MKKSLKILIILVLVCAALVFGVNAIVVASASGDLVDEAQAGDGQADCIMVLGAEVKPDGTPSKMLKDRLDKAIELYRNGAAPKLLMSGDDGQVEYNEVKVMMQYAVDAGVPEKDIFLDHAGFSTYESMYRARDVFGVSSMVVVTQKYHEYRALYIAESLGIDVRGVSAEEGDYMGQGYRNFRELLARDKDFLKCIVKPKPTFLGDPIDIHGDGTVTQ